MSICTLTIRDLPNGQVEVVASPSFERMMQMKDSGHEWTSAEGMLMFAINRVHKEFKNPEPTKILIPKFGH